jgi:hypothetical protein
MQDISQKTGTASEMAKLYARAFDEFGVRALWNMRRFDEPTAADALATARQLRIEGNLAARQLAEDLERAARAHL